MVQLKETVADLLSCLCSDKGGCMVGGANTACWKDREEQVGISKVDRLFTFANLSPDLSDGTATS